MPARRHSRLIAALLLTLGSFTSFALAANEAEVETRMRKDVTFLASDECEGRGVGTKGLDLAADYIATQFTRIGLKPAVKGSYFQPFEVSRGSERVGKAALRLQGPLGQTIELEPGKDFEVVGLSGPGTVSGPLVFVGYGATAKDIGYDDYQGLDVAGKIVVMVRRTPRWGNASLPFDGKRKDEHAALENKIALAEANRAKAVLLVNDASDLTAGDPLVSFQTTARATLVSSIPFLHVRRSVIEDVVRSGLGRSLRDIEQAVDRELKPQGNGPLVGWTASLDPQVKRTTVAVKNVIGVLEGSGPLAKETVVVGAHYDHLGYGGKGSGSRLKDAGQKQIHFGADDNASGTTALLELARRYAADPARQGRRMVFMAFSAEESGLLGSQWYTKRSPVFPLKDTVAMFNLDMVGRLRPDPKTKKEKLLIEGSGTAKTFDSLLEQLNPGFQLSKKPGGNGPSDHDSFYNAKVPVLFFWTGFHDDYHLPTDTADKVDVAGMRRITDYAEKVINRLVSDAERPQYVEVASAFKMSGGAKGPRLGIMPDYDENVAGVAVSAVSKGGPAEKGGLKAGDVIVELAGKAVPNINVYMTVMGQQRAGQAVEVTVVRAGQKLKLKVMPE